MTGSTAERRRISRLTCGVTRRFCFEVDFELVVGRSIVTAVAGIGAELFDHSTDESKNGKTGGSGKIAFSRIGSQSRLYFMDQYLDNDFNNI
jgi:hypothetical protein